MRLDLATIRSQVDRISGEIIINAYLFNGTFIIGEIINAADALMVQYLTITLLEIREVISGQYTELIKAGTPVQVLKSV